MNALADGDFELDGYVLGRSHPAFVTKFDPGMAKALFQDAQHPSANSRLFGRDYKVGPLWSFEFAIAAGREADSVLQEMGALRSKWEREGLLPGEEQTLRYSVGGRVRRVYGRSRNFTYDPNKSLNAGVIRSAGAEFQASDALHYADAEESVTVGLIPGNAGGLVSPLVSPLTTVAGSQRQGVLAVGGDAPAPVRVTFRGPVTNPVASSTGWQIGLNATLAYDQWVTVDTRRGTVLRNDGVSLAGALTRRTYLPEARLRPGAREIIYRGTDNTGTSSCTVAYRPAFYGF